MNENEKHSHKCMFCSSHLKSDCYCNYSQSHWTDAQGITRHIELCASEVCQLKFKLQNYEARLAKFVETDREKSALLDEYRILMYGPSEWQRLKDEGVLDFAFIGSIVNQHVRGLDNLPDPTIVLTLVEMHHKVFTDYSTWIGKNRHKIKLPGSEFVKVKKIPTGVSSKSPEASKTPKEPKAPKVAKAKLSEFEKIVQHNINTFKCTKEQAEGMARALGLQP